MDLRRKTLSKVLAIALMFACAAAFTPLLAGPAFAKAKAKTVKPAQVQGLQLVQADTMTTANEYDVTASWTKLKKNVKKYKIKIADVTDPEVKLAPQTMTVKKKKNKVVFSGTVGSTYEVKVRAIKGKKKGAWSDPQTIAIAENRAALAGVTITMPRVGTVKVGDKLTAAVDPADVNVTWQWFRVKGDEATAIDGAVSAEYTVQTADIGYFLKAVASISEDNLTYTGSAEATTTVAVTTTTSSDGTVTPTPTPTPTPASEEYIEGILTRAYNYNYPDGYKYNAAKVEISGNTLTANYYFFYDLPATTPENLGTLQASLPIAVGDLWNQFAVNKILTKDLSRLAGGLYYSTNLTPEVSSQPNDSSTDDVQNPITRLKVGDDYYEWLLGDLKGSNWRLMAGDNDAAPTQESTEIPTLVGTISELSAETYLCSGAVALYKSSPQTIGATVGAIATGEMQMSTTPIVGAPVGPITESAGTNDSGNYTFTESIPVKVYDGKYPGGYTTYLVANFIFMDPLLVTLITANYPKP